MNVPPSDALKDPGIIRDAFEALSRCFRTRVYGNDGVNFNSLVINADGSINVSGLAFTGSINSTATINVAGSVTLFAIVNTSGSATSNAIVAGTVTAFLAGSVTLNVNQAVVPAHSVTAFVAGVAPGITLQTRSEKQQDTLNAGDDWGTEALGVRNDNATFDLTSGNLNHSPLAVDSKGRLLVNALTATASVYAQPPYLLSVGNSVTGNRNANAIFTGQADDAVAYGNISIGVFGDVSSATNGLEFLTSHDNVTFRTSDSYTYTGGTPRIYTIAPPARYFLVRYTNGAATTGTFYIQTILRSGHVKPSSQRVGDAVSGQHDAEMVKAVLQNQDGAAPSALTTNMPNPIAGLVGACRLAFNGTTWGPVFDNYSQVNGNVSGPGTLTTQPMLDSAALNFTMDIHKTGTISAYNINLEGSIDGAVYFTLVNATSASGADATVFAANKPCKYFRVNVVSITSSGGGVETIRVMAAKAN